MILDSDPLLEVDSLPFKPVIYRILGVNQYTFAHLRASRQGDKNYREV